MFVQSTNVLLLISFSSVWAAPGDTVSAQTINGEVWGVESSTNFENKTAYVFRGIPFAQPPVGNLRFSAPLPAGNWAGVYNATYARSMCVQLQTNLNVAGSEDCLHLNVYTPKLPSENDKSTLNTIVWIHGGGFMLFSADLLLHGADRFLNEDTIIVSVNYRLGIFGWLSTGDGACPGNFGLKDNILALQWVQQNIAFFGGDPNKVTIMGESSGAASVHYLLLSKQAKGLFQNAIAESGDVLMPWALASNPAEIAFALGAANSISFSNSSKLIDGLRNVDANVLLMSSLIIILPDLLDTINGSPFGPVIEGNVEGAVIIGSSYLQLTDGNFNQVPLLHGFNSLEGRILHSLPDYTSLVALPQSTDTTTFIPNDMNVTNAQNRVDLGNNIKSYYFSNISAHVTITSDGFINYVTDNDFIRGIVKSSQLQSNYAPVYLYRFAFTGGLYHDSFKPEGVSHAEELQFLWLNLEYSGSPNETIQTTPEAILTSKRMIQMWTNFAKTGNPTPALTTDVNVIWPVVNNGGTSDLYYMNIDVNLTISTNPQEPQMNYWNNLYNTYGNPPYITY